MSYLTPNGNRLPTALADPPERPPFPSPARMHSTHPQLHEREPAGLRVAGGHPSKSRPAPGVLPYFERHASSGSPAAWVLGVRGGGQQSGLSGDIGKRDEV